LFCAVESLEERNDALLLFAPLLYDFHSDCACLVEKLEEQKDAVRVDQQPRKMVRLRASRPTSGAAPA
jgi:hypothetical protein